MGAKGGGRTKPHFITVVSNIDQTLVKAICIFA
jgi:hypothetical protein